MTKGQTERHFLLQFVFHCFLRRLLPLFRVVVPNGEWRESECVVFWVCAIARSSQLSDYIFIYIHFALFIRVCECFVCDFLNLCFVVVVVV